MFNRNHFIFVIFCSILLSQYLFSQIVLQGTVTDNGGEYLGYEAEPVVNALVTVTDQADPGRTFSSYTDEQGQYTIKITLTGVSDDVSGTPCHFRLLQNYPNPFNPSTVIGYELTQPSHVTINIYDVLGRKVKTLFDGFQTSSGQIVWDTTDDQNQGVTAGLYIYSMQAGDIRFNKKMLLIDGQQGQIKALPSKTIGSVTEVQHQTIFSKTLSDQYTLQVTGDDIETYEQQDIEITSNMTVDVTVMLTVTDKDGNVYQTVKIGGQIWMAENLKVTHYRNGDAIPKVTSSTQWMDITTGAYCNYNNNISNVATYGQMYNWYAVNDSRGIAPEGWHMPTDDEWRELEMVLGMSEIESYSTGWRGTDEGGKLKETGTEHWISPNVGATNETGFTALPGGYRLLFDGSFLSLGKVAIFWTSTELTTGSAFHRNLSYNGTPVLRMYMEKEAGNSVRLIRD